MKGVSVGLSYIMIAEANLAEAEVQTEFVPLTLEELQNAIQFNLDPKGLVEVEKTLEELNKKAEENGITPEELLFEALEKSAVI